MLYGLKRKGVNRSGAALGLIVAIILSIASHAFLACLATFFFTSSRATKYRSHLKRKIENDFKGGKLIHFDGKLQCHANRIVTNYICPCPVLLFFFLI